MKTFHRMAWPKTEQPANGAVDARLTAALVLATFGLCGGLRLLNGPAGPDAAAFFITHDSYGWLAGAEHVNQYSDSVLAAIARIFHALTGLETTALGLWLPVVMAPLAVIPLCLLASWWRLPEGAPVAATLAAASYGFLTRTGPGAFDTDLLTLFFPVCLALCLIVLLEPLLQPAWSRPPAPGRRAVYLQGLGTGLLLRAYLQLYPSGQPVGLAVLGCAALPALLLAEKKLRFDMAAALALVFISGAGGTYGIAAAALPVVLAACAPGLFVSGKTKMAMAAFLAAAFFYVLYSAGILNVLWFDLSRYGRIALQPDAFNLPPTIQTVQEAQAVTLQVAVRHMAGSRLLFIAGLCGYIYCVLRRPVALAFAPLLMLGLAGTMLGSRFTMYGGAVMGAGLGFGLALPLRRWGLRPIARWAVQLALLCMVLWMLVGQIIKEHPQAVLQKEYSQALQALRERAAPDAQLWVWWDSGYAAQYYSRRMTFADGSRNTGEYTVPLARIYGTSSPQYACGLMTFIACQQKASGELDRRGAALPTYPNPFLKLFHDMPPARVQELLQGMESETRDECGPIPEQYLVVSWDTIKIAKTISSLATWDLATGSSRAGTIFPVAGDIQFDMKHGGVTVDGIFHAASGVAILSEKGAKRFSWPVNRTSPFLIGNMLNRELFAVDGGIFTSLLVQMLAAEPKAFEPWFTLVIDRLPYARVYRLNPGAAFTRHDNLRP